LLLGHVGELVLVSVVGRGGEDLGRAGQIEHVYPRHEEEDDPGHDPVSTSARPTTSSMVAIRANRPARAYSVRAMIASTGSVRGSAIISSTEMSAGADQCGIGLVAVASVTNVTVYPRSQATRAVVSQHCSVR